MCVVKFFSAQSYEKKVEHHALRAVFRFLPAITVAYCVPKW